jgi:exodeoxyribonuclease VII large subunit
MYECTVTELNNTIKDLLDSEISKNIKLTGELSSIKRSGKHVFVAIKDSESALDVAFWNQDNFKCKEGDKVIITGRVSFYAKSGRLNFIGYTIEQMGLGAMYTEYQENFEKFKELGYFDNKKELPKHINTIGILTAKEGAALQDILYVLEKNSFCGTVYVYNTVVQGAKCPSSIVNGIKYFEKNHKTVDVLLLSRGGGSFEDLVGFSDPKVVKAIHKCKLFTLSAVGHEVDNMLSDFSANCRAPTPSVAGEVISKQHLDRLSRLEQIENFIHSSIINDKNELNNNLQKLYKFKHRMPDINKDIDREIEHLDNSVFNLHNHVTNSIIELHDKILSYKSKLSGNEHEEILQKGYVLLVNKKGEIINKIDGSEKLKMITTDKEYKVKIKII